MSRTVDERVVSMQFDNKNFEKNVSTSMSTLEKLKQKLSFKGATKGLESIDKAAKKVDMSSLSDSVDTVGVRFSSLQVVATTALANITNSAVNTAKRMASAFTLDPIISGMQEYELQLNSVQTILANTQHEGTNIDIVNRALDELNTYADKTIYNFSEMTRNIGTFTAAGVSLDKSVDAIKGIANLAAVSGSSSVQASTAMYQLSQALAAGKVSLMDWNSVVNAGMGGKVFQDALKRTATQMGTNVDAMIEKYGSFRESLTEGGWLTADVLTETLKQFAGAYSEADLIQQGYSESQAKEIVKMAQTAEEAATKVKTFTQLIDTTKEALGSGWAQTWRLVFGDFEQAKELWTGISDVVSGFINDQSNARNELLGGALNSNLDKMKDNLDKVGVSSNKLEESLSKTLTGKGYDVDALTEKYGSLAEAFKAGAVPANLLTETLGTLKEESLKGADGLKITREEAENLWKEIDTLSQSVTKLGGRDLLIDSFKNIFNGLASAVKPVTEAFREIFPPTTSEQLYKAIESFHNLTENFKLSETSADNLKRTFKGLFSILDIGKKAVTAVLDPLGDFLFGGSIGSAAGSLLKITASIGDLFTNLNKGLEAGKGFSAISDAIGGVLGVVSDAISGITGGVDNLGNTLSNIGTKISDVFNGIMDAASDVVGWFKENIDSSDIFAGLAGGGIFVLLKNLGGLFKQAKDLLGGGLKGLLFGNGDDADAESIGDKFSGILDSVHSSLASFTTGLNVASLVGVAGAVMMLSSAVRTLSDIEPAKVAYSTATIAALLGILNGGFRTMSKTLVKFNAKGLIRAGVTMMTLAKAIDILATAMEKLSGLSWSGIAKGLTGVTAGLLALSGAFKIISSGKGINLRSSIAILALAKACVILSDAMGSFSTLSWSEIARGLTAMGGALLELSGALSIMSKVGGFGSLLGSVGLVIAVQSLNEIAAGLEKLGGLSWSEIGKGLSAMGVALTEFTIALSVLSKVGGFGSILGGTGLLIAVQSLNEISENLASLGGLSWSEIGKGLSAMGAALMEFTVALSVLSKVGGFGSILGGTGLLIAVQSLEAITTGLERLGLISWSEIGKGLSAMGGALVEFTIALSVLSKVGGFGSILGATGILIAVQSLGEISENLQYLGLMSWGEIGRGLSAMGGALVEIGVVTGALGKLAGFSGIIGGGAILITVQGLKDIAEALQEFGTMAWDEIGRGLTAMAGALAATGLASALTGFAGLAGIIGSGTILIAAQGLMDIAKALQEFGSMDWDEIGRGLTAMGGALAETALGGLLNTLSGLGAASIDTMAEPLGKLADSVKKWAGVTVPEGLGTNLGILADGIKKFTFGGFGADAIATVAEPLGTLASSVNKWANVTVPEGIGDKLSALANGVKSFTWAFAGGFSIATVAEPLGQLASSVNKWKDVTVPEGLGDKLSSLASGIQSFSFAFLGGWSIDASAEPLGQLADAVSKWKDVTVPEGMKDGLVDLSDGIKSFSIFSDWKIDDIAEPLSGIADAVQKWNNVTIPEGMGEALGEIADGISSFGIFSDWRIDDIAGPLGDLGTAIQKWNNVYISTSIGDNLPVMADALKSLKSVDFDSLASESISSAITNVKNLINTINSMSGINTGAIETFSTAISSIGKISMDGIATSLQTAAIQVQTSITNLLNTITTSLNSGMTAVSASANIAGQNIGKSIVSGLQTGSSNIGMTMSVVIASISASLASQSTAFHSAGVTMGNNLASGISTSVSAIPSKISGTISGIASSIRGQSESFRSAGTSLIQALSSGFTSGQNKLTSAANTIMNSMLNTIRGKSSGFKSAATTLITSFANGISGSVGKVTSAVGSMMRSAVSATNGYYSSFYSSGLNLAKGFANGISANSYMAAARASAMASAAATAARRALNEHSPSRVMYKIGDFAGLGFVNALKDYVSVSEKAGSNVANSAVSGLRDTLSSLGRAIDGGIEINPTIRPVLDMSNVRSGIGVINGLSGLSPSMSILADVQSINSSVNGRSQNGGNGEVVSELRRLRTSIKEMPRNSYNIGDVTYDDGSAVGDAVSALVRAARIERRR